MYWQYSDSYGNICLSFSDRNYIFYHHTADDPYLQLLTRQLLAQAGGLDKVGLAGFILSFVQNLEYISDADFAGRTEYWKYPPPGDSLG